MLLPMDRRSRGIDDASPDFVYAVSLLAALEGLTGENGHEVVLPFLGMVRAELTDFGQRRPATYVLVETHNLHDGLVELEERLTALMADSQVLRDSLRLDSARRMLRRGAAAIT